MNKRALIFLVIALVTLFICGGVVTHVRAKTIVLELALYSGNSWGVPQNFAYAIFDKAVEMFEQRYVDKGYKVILKTGTMYKDYSERFAQLVLKGKEPDIFLIIEEDFNTYAAIGLLEKLDRYIQKDNLSTDVYFTNALKAGQYQGSQYSIPIGIVPSFLIVNTDLLHALDLSIDLDNWTWGQFYSLCEQITADLDDDGIIDRFGVEGYDWHHAFYTNDVTLFNAESSKAGFNHNRMSELLQYLKQMHALNRGELIREGSFERGNAGFKTFNLSEFRVYGSYPYRILRFNNFDWEAVPFPRGPHGESMSKLYTVQLGMSSRSKNKKIAFEFLKFISSDEDFQFQIWDHSNMLPVNRNVFEKIYDSGVMLRDGMRPLDRSFIESVISNSYIDPDFKRYPVIDEYITQRIFTMIAQDADVVKGTNELEQLINELLVDEYSSSISSR